MFRITLLAAILVLIAGCAFDDHQAELDAAAQAENDRLKSEAATLRDAVAEQKMALEALKQQSQQ